MFNHTELLTKIGLDEKEARVYLASLRIGKATADQLSKEAGILRTTTYHQIESLMKKGLLSSFTIGKKNFFIVESPANLTRLLDSHEHSLRENRSLLSSTLPELISMFSKTGDRPAVRFFPGKEGLTTMREESLHMERKELLIVSNYRGLLDTYSQEERDSFSKRRFNQRIKSRVIYTTDPTTDATFEYTAKKYSPTNVRVMPDASHSVAFDIYLFDDKVCLCSYDPDIWGVMVVGKAIHDSVKLLYEIAWSASRPV